MGFPIGYTEVLLPRLLLNALSFLGFIRRLILFFLSLLGLSDFLEPEIVWPDSSPSPNHHHYVPYLQPAAWYGDLPSPVSTSVSVSASLIREMLPVIKFSDLAADAGGSEPPERCAVCLYDFEADEEIRRLRNCRHIFHQWCLDRWMDCDRSNCPLCRTPFVPDELQDAFNERLWAAADDVSAASPASDLYGEYLPIPNLL